MAFLVVLESLSPVERAVFLLHDVFRFRFDEIARVVGKSVVHTRQIAVRARKHVEAEGSVGSVMELHVADGRVAAIHSIVNPDKLRHLPPMGASPATDG